MSGVAAIPGEHADPLAEVHTAFSKLAYATSDAMALTAELSSGPGTKPPSPD